MSHIIYVELLKEIVAATHSRFAICAAKTRFF